MSNVHPVSRRRTLLIASALCAAAVLPGYAADAVAPAAPATATAALPTAPSPNATINLIRLMVERGLIPAADAQKLIAQAEAEAVQARAAIAAATAQPAGAPVSDDTVRVTYIPGSVRRQMVEEVRQDVMSQASQENWAAPRTFPDWVSRWKFAGDMRIRYEGISYPTGNATGLSSNFWNYNSINTASSPYDIKGAANPPLANADQNRDRTRLRARLGAEIDLEEGFTSGFRLATGESNSPVSQNQSFGAVNSGQSGGNFSKYSIWLDRGFLKYEKTMAQSDWSISLGRIDNPFFSTTMLWANDLGFDGLVIQGRRRAGEDRAFRPFATLGAFPVFNTDLNFSSTNPNKFKSTDKWLTAAQIGTEWTINKDFSAKAAVALYDFQNIEGKLSDPYTPLLSSDAGNTDSTRPAFAQKGNTYMALRDITPNATNAFGTTNQWQYFGLATPFRDVVLTGRLDYAHFDPIVVSLIGEFVQNVAFNRGDINAKAVNNLDAANKYQGGDMGYIVNLQVGHAALDQRWDWNVALGYRYVESDAVVDGFTDSDFGGGGTNLKGYTLGGNLALGRRVWLGMRLYSADSIAGPTYKNDIIQLDFNGRF